MGLVNCFFISERLKEREKLCPVDVPLKLNHLFKYRRLDEKLKFPSIFVSFQNLLESVAKK